MLSPQSNPFRQFVDLSGFWALCFDPANEVRTADRPHGFSSVRPVAVPASWNDQFEDGRADLGQVWYQTSQSPIRMGSLNIKGIVTRDRRPKLGAHRLRER